jgi:hypothetical protein
MQLQRPSLQSCEGRAAMLTMGSTPAERLKRSIPTLVSSAILTTHLPATTLHPSWAMC